MEVWARRGGTFLLRGLRCRGCRATNQSDAVDAPGVVCANTRARDASRRRAGVAFLPDLSTVPLDTVSTGTVALPISLLGLWRDCVERKLTYNICNG